MKSLMLVLLLAVASPAFAQFDHDAQRRMAEQKVQLSSLDFMDGEWRGTTVMTQPDGSQRTLTQTERIGPLLDGAVKVVEGRGYSPDGVSQFNALGIISWDADKQAYRFHSYAMGSAGDFDFERTADGYKWRIPAGPATIEYVAVIKNGEWHEVGSYLIAGQPPRPFIEMKLKRIGDSNWPIGVSVPYK